MQLSMDNFVLVGTMPVARAALSLSDNELPWIVTMAVTTERRKERRN